MKTRSRPQTGNVRRPALALAAAVAALAVLAAACVGNDGVVAPTPTTAAIAPSATESEQAMPAITPSPPAPRPVDTVQPTGDKDPDLAGTESEQAMPAATPSPPTPRPVGALQPGDYRGPDLADTGAWFNSQPTTIGLLLSEGRVVLVDFWTYTCINCLRTLPFLRDWHEKYSERGLTILGVHAPEFEFEKLSANVAAAIEDHGIGWPVVQDNQMETWRAFRNRYWPAKYLIGVDGKTRFSHFGEGEYLEMEHQIRLALEAAGYDVSDIEEGGVAPPERDPDAPTVTRELYMGYGRNYSAGLFDGGGFAGQSQYYDAGDRVVDYTDDPAHAHNKWYLQGLWKNEREAIVHARETAGPDDYIALKFAARSVNVVINPVRPDEPFDVVIEIDGKPLSPAEAGADIVFGDEGRSILRVDGSRLYRIVEQPEWSVRELNLRSRSDNFAVFAFTFGIYDGGA